MVWWNQEAEDRVMGQDSSDGDDRTQQFQPDMTEPGEPGSPGDVRSRPEHWDRVLEFPGQPMRVVAPIPPRLSGWALAFTIVGVSFCFVMLVVVVLAILFADQIATVP